MYVCVECRVAMQCEKNEVAADFGSGHVYLGDRFKCPTCGKMILNTNGRPVHDPDHLASVEYLKMEKS